MSIAASATDIWTGSKHVSWDDGGLQIAADQFAAAQPGNLIKVHFTGATDGIEFKVMNPGRFDHLAGSREAAWISGDGAFEQFLTQTAVDSLKAYGLEIIGANFTCTKVELLESKTPKDGYTVWTGFFWADNWTTLELYRDGYCNVDLSHATALRIYSEANRSDFAINIKENWDPEGQIADQTAMTAGEGYMELPLTDDLRTRLANASHWMIQFNKEAGDPFNVTDVVLVMAAEPVVDYYLVGSINSWNVVDLTDDLKFAANPNAEGEYMINYDFAANDEFKVVGRPEGTQEITWFPAGMDNNYVITATGNYTVYFRPDGQGGSDWHYGFFYVEATPQGIEQTNANAKAVKSFRNGMLVIEKNGKFYNALGAEVK